MTRDDDLRVLLDRQHIYDVIVRYCRGVDRGDRELLRSVYHEDAIDDHGMFKGKGSDFADWTYCISCSEAGTTTATVYNRYIDRFEKRDGEWKIADRKVVLDVTRLDPVTERYGEAQGYVFPWGTKGRSDPSYRT